VALGVTKGPVEENANTQKKDDGGPSKIRQQGRERTHHSFSSGRDNHGIKQDGPSTCRRKIRTLLANQIEGVMHGAKKIWVRELSGRQAFYNWQGGDPSTYERKIPELPPASPQEKGIKKLARREKRAWRTGKEKRTRRGGKVTKRRE